MHSFNDHGTLKIINYKGWYLSYLFFVFIIMSTSFLGTTVTAKEMMDDTLLALRQMELAADARIERLSVDMSVADQQWQDARIMASSLVFENDSQKLSSLKSSAYWEQLKAIRAEIENTQKLREWYQNHRNIRKLYLMVRNAKSFDSQTWQTIADSSKAHLLKVVEECQWLEERMRENRYELESIDKRIVGISDSLELKQVQWLVFRKEYLIKQQKNDSLFHFIGTTNIDPAFQTYLTVAQNFLNTISLSQRAKDIIKKLSSIWRFEIRNVDGQPLTIGKIVIAILVIFIGIKVAQIISVFIGRFITRRLSLEVGLVDAGQKLFFYTFSVLFTLYALHSIQVPLTAFALVGGALALGIGFGSQNILNNFISGIILLFERPIKRSDFVEIDGSLGTIESIGLRSTRIRTPGNIHMVIPNSNFLEKTVINWTLANRMVRQELEVGVVYGSETQEVKRLLLLAAEEVKRVLMSPKPMVLFSNFGDNSLVFHLLFWMEIQSILDRRTIMSDLRFKVNDLFNDANIVIAFPQRDVHLDTTKPLQIVLEKPTDF